MRFLITAVLLAASLHAQDATPSTQRAGRSRAVRQPEITDPTAWVRAHAAPLHGVDPELSWSDLAPLDRYVDQRAIIALGDASHGTREFYQIKHRLIEYLIAQHGFNVIAFEGPWPLFNRINDWIQGGGGDPAPLLYDEVYWFWNAQELLDLVWWLRQYNDSRGDRPAVRVIGIDPYSPDALIDDVISYLRAVDPAAVASAKAAYSCLRTSPSGNDEMSAMGISDHGCVQAADKMIASLVAQRDSYIARSSSALFERVLQSARMIRQSAQIRFGPPHLWQETRDRVMAENLIWLRETAAGSPQKLIFWGHNLHVSRRPYILSAGGRENRSTGTVLAERYGNDYYVIATATLHGRWMGITSQAAQTFGTAEIPDLPENSYERLFAAAGEPVLFIPLRGVNAPQSITAARPTLIMFASPVYQIFTLPVPEMYDSVIFIEESTETTLLIPQ